MKKVSKNEPCYFLLHQLIKAESRTLCQMIKAFIFALKKQ